MTANSLNNKSQVASLLCAKQKLQCIFDCFTHKAIQHQNHTDHNYTKSPTQLGEKPFMCNACGHDVATEMEFKGSADGRLPTEDIEEGSLMCDIQQFKCIMCDYETDQKDELTQHILNHSYKEPFSSSTFYFKSSPKAPVQLHLKFHNGAKPLSYDVDDYNSSKYIYTNSFTVIDEKPFKCNICSYKTPIRGNFNQHMKIHNSNKPFVCTFCDYKATTKGNLKQHMAIHSRNRPFLCGECDYKTCLKGNLKQHVKLHTGEKTFSCRSCEFKTCRKTDMYNHERTHTGEKPFTCILCGYKTSQKRNLSPHIVKAHTVK